VTISWPAPDAAARRATASPMGPWPSTITVSPSLMSSRSTQLSPTANGSSSAAPYSGTPSGIGTRFTAGTAIRSPRQPSDHSPISFLRGQSSGRPSAQAAHSPHSSDGLTANWRPANAGSTPSPTDSTVPAKSCPGTRGNGESIRPSYWWASVPHSEATSTLTTTHPGTASGSGRSWTST
jgi:hypothetical protein